MRATLKIFSLRLINVFCVLIVVKKCIPACSGEGSLLVFCTAQKQDTFGAYDQNYKFAQPAVQTASCDK